MYREVLWSIKVVHIPGISFSMLYITQDVWQGYFCPPTLSTSGPYFIPKSCPYNLSYAKWNFLSSFKYIKRKKCTEMFGPIRKTSRDVLVYLWVILPFYSTLTICDESRRWHQLVHGLKVMRKFIVDEKKKRFIFSFQNFANINFLSEIIDVTSSHIDSDAEGFVQLRPHWGRTALEKLRASRLIRKWKYTSRNINFSDVPSTRNSHQGHRDPQHQQRDEKKK